MPLLEGLCTSNPCRFGFSGLSFAGTNMTIPALSGDILHKKSAPHAYLTMCCTGKYHQRGNNQGANAKREKIAHKPGQYNVGTQIQQTRTVSCGLVLRRYSTLHHRKQTCRPQCEDEKYLCADGAGKRTSEHCIEMLHTKTRSNISFIPFPSAVRGPHLERYRSGPRQWLACSTRQGVRIRATIRG